MTVPDDDPFAAPPGPPDPPLDSPAAWVLVVAFGSLALGLGFGGALQGGTAPLAVGVLFALGLPAVILGSIRFSRSLRRR